MNRRKHELNKLQLDADFAAARDLAQRLRQCIDLIRALETAIGVRRGTIAIGGWGVNDPRSTEQLEADLARLREQRRQLEQADRDLKARIANRARLVERCDRYIQRADREAPRVIEPPDFRGKAAVTVHRLPMKTTDQFKGDLGLPIGGDVPGGNPLSEPVEKRWGLK